MTTPGQGEQPGNPWAPPPTEGQWPVPPPPPGQWPAQPPPQAQWPAPPPPQGQWPAPPAAGWSPHQPTRQRPGGSRAAIAWAVAGVISLIIAGSGFVLLLADRVINQPSPRPPVTPIAPATPTASSPKPTPKPTPTPTVSATDPVATVPVSGSTIDGGAFTFALPEGWSRSSKSGSGNDVQISDAAGNTITVYSWTTSATAKARCDTELKVLQIWVPGEITPLPAITMGGTDAPGGTLSGKDFYELRCAAHKGVVYNLALKTTPATQEKSVAVMRAVAAAWVWKG